MAFLDEPISVTDILKLALSEDLGSMGDITSRAIIGEADMGRALIRGKQCGVLSGVSLIAPLYELVDAYLQQEKGLRRTNVEILRDDGDAISVGDVICKIEGPTRSILCGERVILNLLQHLSGVATITAQMVLMLKGVKTKLLDTRKTTPCLRALEKAAVRHGGGENHRAGLYDMILIKDTHIKHAGGVGAALKKAATARGVETTPMIEVEVRSIDEFVEAMPFKPDRIMLDNMSHREIAHCVYERDASGLDIKLEASGNISLSTISAIVNTGVDYISSGAITHSAPALDIHLAIV